ncbi:MAG TPA: hypothetical protein H9902_11510 [Candidatus Stackebrandtia faecavium]|nr:hypothetical protein [Candidatus Stackebrandtia faecavium]
MTEAISDSNDETETETPRKPWYSWFARHKVLTIAASGACIAIGVATVLVVPAPASTSERLVDEYLSALQDGDASAALEIAGGGDTDGALKSPTGGDNTRRSVIASDFLTDDATGTDWATESVREINTEIVHETDDRVVELTRVLATGTHEDQLLRGLFTVVDDSREDGVYLEKPFAYIDTGAFQDSVLAINGTAVSIDEASPSMVAIFPGAHEVFTGSDLFESKDPQSSLMAMPPAPIKLSVPDLHFTDKGEDAANTAVKDRLDECARSTATHPKNCPFGGDDIGWDDEDPQGIWTNDGSFSDLKDLEWEIETYPEFDFRVSGTKVTAAVTDPGWATLSGKSKGKKFSVECEIGNVIGNWTADQRMSFDSSENRPPGLCTTA